MTESLKIFRKEIDRIDNKIIDLLQRRFEIFREVGKIKSENNLAIIQTDRVKEVLEHVTTLAESKNIPVEFIHNFYSNMIDEAHKIETAIKQEQEKENK